MNFLYKDATIFLTRKQEKMVKVFDYPLHGKTSKYVGVSFNKKNGKWFACTYIKGKQIALGHHDTQELAKQAYDSYKSSQVIN